MITDYFILFINSFLIGITVGLGVCGYRFLLYIFSPNNRIFFNSYNLILWIIKKLLLYPFYWYYKYKKLPILRKKIRANGLTNTNEAIWALAERLKNTSGGRGGVYSLCFKERLRRLLYNR